MKMKYKVCLYTEMYSDIEIEAESREEAENLVLSGEFTDENIVEITTRASEIIG